MFLDDMPALHKQKISQYGDSHTRYGAFDDGIQAENVGAFIDGMDRDAPGRWVEAS